MSRNEKWVIAIHNSDEGADVFQGVLGDAEDVINIINEMIDINEKNYSETFERKDAGINDDGSIYGSADFTDSHIDYSAKRVNDIFAISFVPEYADYEIAAMKQRLAAFSDRYTDHEIASIREAVKHLEHIRRIFSKGKITVDEAVTEIQRIVHTA